MNTCTVFISTGAFSVQVRVVYDWLLLDWNALQVGLMKEAKREPNTHIHIITDTREADKWWAECCEGLYVFYMCLCVFVCVVFTFVEG